MLKYHCMYKIQHVQVSRPIKRNGATEIFHWWNFVKKIYALSVQPIAQLFNPGSAHAALGIRYPVSIQSRTYA